MDDKLISIIIPIYNVGKYIKRCVESLIVQKYSNIEIILVDDGSSDDSAIIIDTLASIDTRINVIHKENEGVSSARNIGIENAKGEYIMFVDGDDWVDNEYVSYFVNLINKSGCDIGMNKNNYYVSKYISNENMYIITSEKAMEWIYLGELFVAVWNKIYKTSLIKDNGIFFNKKIWYGEGMLFNIECLQYIDKVAIGEKCVYHQTFNPNSAMRSFNLNSNYCGIKSLELQKKIWKKSNKKIENAWEYHRYCFNRNIIDGLVRTGIVNVNYDIFNKCVHNLRRNILIPLKTEKKLKKIAIWVAYYINPMFMAKRNARKYKKSLNSLKNL